MHRGGLMVFTLAVQELLNIEQISRTSQQNHIYKRKLQQTLGTMGKLLMSGISWGRFHHLKTYNEVDIEFCIIFNTGN